LLRRSTLRWLGWLAARFVALTRDALTNSVDSAGQIAVNQFIRIVLATRTLISITSRTGLFTGQQY
jgi:hypothetical protein